MTAASEHTGILEANMGFYRAFESLDAERMKAVWLDSTDVVCIHPGWPAKVGIGDVMDSWRVIFRSTSYMKFTVDRPLAAAFGDTVWVTCVEVISSGDRAEPDFASVQAVNAFCRADGEWKMILHHASQYAPVI